MDCKTEGKQQQNARKPFFVCKAAHNTPNTHTQHTPAQYSVHFFRKRPPEKDAKEKNGTKPWKKGDNGKGVKREETVIQKNN